MVLLGSEKGGWLEYPRNRDAPSTGKSLTWGARVKGELGATDIDTPPRAADLALFPPALWRLFRYVGYTSVPLV